MKVKRQLKILEIIRENDIDTQETLVELLNKEGFGVTQATVSRDIRELKLSKVSAGKGRQKYALTPESDSTEIMERMNRVFSDGVVSIDYAGNLIIIKTITGMAMAVAAALDAMDNTEIIGTIAGDDTVFSAVRNENRAIRLVDRLRNGIQKR